MFDTNALIFLLVDSPRLTAAARQAALTNERARWVSAASIYEVTLKSRRGRLSVDPRVFRHALRAGGFQVRPVTEQVMYLAASLDWSNRDPWDRIIGATATVAGGALVSSDRAFDDLPAIPRIW